MSIPFKDLISGMGDRTWGPDPQNVGACCRKTCPVPVYTVPSPATPGAPSTMKGLGGRMRYLRGFGADPSGEPAPTGGPLTMAELAFLPQAQLTPQDQLAAAQGRNRRTGMRVPPGSGSTPFEIEKHSRARTVAPGETFQYIDLGLVGERF